MAASGGATIELEHAIGLNGSAVCPLHMLGQGGSACAYVSGASVVLADLADPHQQHFLRGHDDAVSCLAVSASGRLAASGQRGANADVIVWDLEARVPVYRLQEHDDGVATVAFSDDERFLVTVGVLTDGKMVVWDMHTGGVVVSHRRVDRDGTRPRPTLCVCWGGRKKDAKRRDTTMFQLATGGEGQLYFWTLDPAAGALLPQEVNTGVNRNITSVAFSFDRDYLYAGSSSGDFMAVNVKQAVMHSVTSACSNSVSVLVCLPPVPRGDDELLHRLLVGGGDGSVSVWIGNGRTYHRAAAAEPALPGGVSALSLWGADAPPGAPVRTVATTQRGLVFELTLAPFGDPTNARRLLQEYHCGPVRAVAYSVDQSASFVTACDDGWVRLWDASSYGVASKGELQPSLVGRPLCLGFTGEVVMTGWEDGKLRAHDGEDGALLWVLDNVHKGGVSALCVSHNGKFLVTGGEEGDVRVWEIRTRLMIRHLKEHTMAVTSVVIANGDDKVYTASRDRSILCWDLVNGARRGSLIQRMGGINDFALHPDGLQLVSVGQEKKITFWDVREPSPLQLLELNHEQHTIAISADGSLFATAGADMTVRLWHMSTSELLAEGLGHSATVRAVAFAPDGKQLVSAGDDGSVLVWNIFYL